MFAHSCFVSLAALPMSSTYCAQWWALIALSMHSLMKLEKVDNDLLKPWARRLYDLLHIVFRLSVWAKCCIGTVKIGKKTFLEFSSPCRLSFSSSLCSRNSLYMRCWLMFEPVCVLHNVRLWNFKDFIYVDFCVVFMLYHEE